MKKLVSSTVFVASNMLASLLVVVLLVRAAETDERAAFFIFQTVFFPLVALLSQANILRVFRSSGLLSRAWAADIPWLLGAFVLIALVAAGRFSLLEMLMLSLTIPAAYQTAAGVAAVQSRSKHPMAWGWPLLSAIVRVAVCLVLIQYSIVIVFFCSTLAGFLVSLLATRLLQHADDAPTTASQSHISHLATLGFFAVSSFAFQWDRILLGQYSLDQLVIVSGACFVWVLSPISALFSTIYRARAGAIFADTPREKKQKTFLRATKLFVIGVAGFAGFVLVAWQPLNAIAFPFVEASVLLPLTLIAAVACDRIGNLRLFSFGGSSRTYITVAMAKTCTIILGVLFVALLGYAENLQIIYSTYLVIAVAYMVFVWRAV